MPRALYTAATGMSAQQLKIDVIAHNLANINTTGFKRSRLEFQDLIYQNLRTAGAENSSETQNPVGLQIGHGVRPTATHLSMQNGDLQATENPLDLAIEGPGFFQVRLPGGELAYTRAGSMKVSSRGELVNSDGYAVEPPIIIPTDATAITVGTDGVVSAKTGGSGRDVQLGRIQLAQVFNPGSLEAMGRNLYRLSGDPGEVRVGNPGEDGLGALSQGYLEASNVKVVEELIAMIVGQRAYEANSKVISTADQMLDEANRLR